MSAGSFRGFPPEAITFYRGLEADNSRAWWQEHKPEYDAHVRGPFESMLAELDDRYGPFHVFRPNRDVRFSKDKTPYKTNIAAVGEREGGAAYYVSFSADGLMAGAGYYAMASDQLERFRAAVDDDARGDEVDRLVRDLQRATCSIGAIAELKTAPRGVPKDHPRIELLRRKGLMTFRSWPVAKWLHTRAALDRVTGLWDAAAPLCDWLDAHVGPSTLPPPDFDR